MRKEVALSVSGIVIGLLILGLGVNYFIDKSVLFSLPLEGENLGGGLSSSADECGGGDFAVCGDGNSCGEECDDGCMAGIPNLCEEGIDDNDGCSWECKWECASPPCVIEGFDYCGNHILDIGEECDDGNKFSGDGCSDECTLEGVYPDMFRVFVTSSAFDGDLRGLNGADNKCQNAANDANLGGKWIAWLSEEDVDASGRLYSSSVQFKLLDGGAIAEDSLDFLDGNLGALIDVDEFGQKVNDGLFVWTGSQSTGLKVEQFPGLDSDSLFCKDWITNSFDEYGIVGNYMVDDPSWSFDHARSCDSYAHLYCIEQPFRRSEISSSCEMKSESITIRDGEPYIGENVDNPKWVWMLRNLHLNTYTQIDSPNELYGPVIGVANKFRATNLNGDVLKEPNYGGGASGLSSGRSAEEEFGYIDLTPLEGESPVERDRRINAIIEEEGFTREGQSFGGASSVSASSNNEIVYDRWSFPDEYVSILFEGVYPNEYSDKPDDRGSLDISMKREVVDITQAVGVPQEYQQYLKSNADVVSLSVNAPKLAPFDDVPVIFGWTGMHLGVEENFWANDLSNPDIGYSAILKNVNEDHSADFGVNKRVCVEDSFGLITCDWTYNFEQFTLQLGAEMQFHDVVIYNYDSGYYPEGEEWKEWAVVGRKWYGNENELSEEMYTSYLFYYIFYDKDRGMDFIMTLFSNKNGEIEFNKVMVLYDLRKRESINFYYGWTDIFTGKVDGEFFGVNVWRSTWPSEEHYADNLIGKFKLESDGDYYEGIVLDCIDYLEDGFFCVQEENQPFIFVYEESQYSLNLIASFGNAVLLNLSNDLTDVSISDYFTEGEEKVLNGVPIMLVFDGIEFTSGGDFIYTATLNIGDKKTSIVSLGNIPNVAEDSELVYYYMADGFEYPGVGSVEIGGKNFDMKTASGMRVKNPSLNFLNDEIKMSILHDDPWARMALQQRYPGWEFRRSTRLGQSVVGHLNWLGLDWIYNAVGDNSLGLVLQGQEFNGDFVLGRESLIFGVNTPRVETSLTAGNDEYEDRVYVETKEAYGQGFSNEGMKMVYAFDTPVDLTRLRSDNPIDIRFLGKNMKLLDLNPDGSLSAEICTCSHLMKENEYVSSDGKFVRLARVYQDGSVDITVSGRKDNIPEFSGKNINGVRVYNAGANWFGDWDENNNALIEPNGAECGPICGNGYKEIGELCDDGNLDESDDCDNLCNPITESTPPSPPLEEPNAVKKNRYVSFASGYDGTSAFRVTFKNLPSAYSQFNGMSAWVGYPDWICETSHVGVGEGCLLNTFIASQLKCEPHYNNWNYGEAINVFGSEIIPSSFYDIQAIKYGCPISNEECYSAPLEVETTKWGDISGNNGVPDGEVGINDALEVIKGFSNAPDRLSKKRQDLVGVYPNEDFLDHKIEISDVLAVLKGFGGLDYRFDFKTCEGELSGTSGTTASISREEAISLAKSFAKCPSTAQSTIDLQISSDGQSVNYLVGVNGKNYLVTPEGAVSLGSGTSATASCVVKKISPKGSFG